ncbi:putative Enoyl-CoA hydratase/isomerase [Frankia canadensis]|uniref:Putative Enoyl-CoA hydratase/isomerase n=1 Tax=Frankia canadensis TaxID=1836972 RepID=A0A2I2KZY4_9ACTN|nr:enoyl-CoA hydratase-related protein [Frankia canadensis]SNQ51207.1 putative Enoyl-CoA hydratase/isomerase [Frankia canadensis]SOU58497.1 putative Enoyl-CoA hydratase/isomerase [Frankia canadensis]
MSESGVVLVHDDGGIRRITLNRPDRLNAFTVDSYRALGAAVAAADADDSVSVVLLTGAGRAFCAGADLVEIPRSDQTLVAETFRTMLLAVVGLSKPLVARVHGPAVGVGMTLLLHCDLVVVAESARLRAPFAEIGTAPETMSSVLLPRAVGPQRAAELLFTSRWISSAEAVEYGLALRRCADDELDGVVGELARTIAAFPPAVLASTKRLLRAGQAELASPDAAAAVIDRETAEGAELGRLFGFPRR